MSFSLSAYLLELSLHQYFDFLQDSLGFQTCAPSISSHARSQALPYCRSMGSDPSGPMSCYFLPLQITKMIWCWFKSPDNKKLISAVCLSRTCSNPTEMVYTMFQMLCDLYHSSQAPHSCGSHLQKNDNGLEKWILI